jgi:hypothetical protein
MPKIAASYRQRKASSPEHDRTSLQPASVCSELLLDEEELQG